MADYEKIKTIDERILEFAHNYYKDKVLTYLKLKLQKRRELKEVFLKREDYSGVLAMNEQIFIMEELYEHILMNQLTKLSDHLPIPKF